MVTRANVEVRLLEEGFQAQGTWFWRNSPCHRLCPDNEKVPVTCVEIHEIGDSTSIAVEIRGAREVVRTHERTYDRGWFRFEVYGIPLGDRWWQHVEQAESMIARAWDAVW